ncbi:MAG TPA: transcriptional regulator [Pseudonocardiaceae bacterium]|nr:transcriptional regulator [Pseudonocardiaceae bacterium]
MTSAPASQRPSIPPRRPVSNCVARRLVLGAADLVGRLGQALVASGVLVGLVAVLPWALWHYIGWPLPDHAPTPAEMQAVLSGPLTTPLLLDLLACLCWITWAAFVIDVARCVLAAARGLRWPELPTSGPVHAVAAILVAGIVVSLLGNRSPSITTAGITEAINGHGQGVATTTLSTVRTASVTQDADTVVVRAPENGIHDSLSRIAARTLGAAGRWPEIFVLNKGKPQPYGGRLTNPNLIYPGERLSLPSSISAATGADHRAAPDTMPAPAPPRPTPTTSPPARPNTAPVHSVVPTPHGDPTMGSRPAIGQEPGVFVGLGLAAAVSTTLVVARRRYRRRYRPGSGRRDDLPVGPVIYQLRLAHLRAEHGDPCAEGTRDDGEHHPRQAPPLVIGATHDTPPDEAENARLAPGLGIRDGREIALDLAVACGLGLVGAGACAAARALLLALLTPPPVAAECAQVIMPTNDLALLLGREHVHGRCPPALRVVADLDAALDELETEMLRRAREAGSTTHSAWPPMALVARPAEQNTQRLQAILDNGAPLGLVGVLLDQWRPGISAYIRDDGTVSSASPGPGQALLGSRMFHLPEAETAELLTLLRQAQPDTPDARDDTNEVAGDAALEVTAIPSEAPEGINPHLAGGLTPPAERQPPPPHAEPNSEPTKQGAAVATRATAAPDETGHRNAHTAPITLTVLGRPRVLWTLDHTVDTREGRSTADGAVREITSAFPPRQREMLAFLALHPQGVHRDALVAALWAHNAPERPTNALNTALSRLRRAVNQATGGAISDLTTTGEGHYQLDPSLVTVDCWQLCDAVAARRTASTNSERIAAYQRIVDCYRGPLAEGVDAEWIEGPREATRRDALDAVAALARALVDSDPQRTLDLLETARAFDPHNELLYRDIMRLQHRLGHLDAISRTLALLTTRLAEIDESPTAQALELAARLQQRHASPDNDTPAPGRRVFAEPA